MLSRKTVTAHLIALSVLAAGFLLCRHAFLELHGMKQWPLLLFGVALAALLVSFLGKRKRMPFFIPAAYLIGFAVGVILQSDGVDAGGGRSNNLWLIWTTVFALLLVAGVICELLPMWQTKE